MRCLLAFVPMVFLACVTGGGDEMERRANAVSDGDLVGVAINVRWDEQRPSVEDLQRLGARWVRTIVYKDNHDQAASTLASYRCLGVRSMVLLNQESFESTGSIPSGDDDGEWETYASVFADNAAAYVSAHQSAIDAVEVWNEPDLPTGGNIPPHRFGLLMYKTYPRLKEILGSKPVVQGAVAGSSWPTYLSDASRWMNERGNYSDGVGVHPYGQRAGGYPDGYGFGEIESVVRTAFERGNEARMGGWKPVWISEFGLPREAGDASTYIRRAYSIFDRLRGEGMIKHAFWFAWDDTTHYDPSTETFGLVERSGSPRPLRDSGVTFSQLAGPLAACGASEPASDVGGGAIRSCYDRNGGEPKVGRPFDNGGGVDVHRWGYGSVQDFNGGSLGPNVCMQRDGSGDGWMVRGAIRDLYLASGGPEGWLGYPVEDEHGVAGAPYQRFEHGFITHHDGEWRALTEEAAPAPATSCACRGDLDNFCLYGATDGCSMTLPGGYCDPDGNGDFADADWVRGWNEFKAACAP
jgi:hypothetical protein